MVNSRRVIFNLTDMACRNAIANILNTRSSQQLVHSEIPKDKIIGQTFPWRQTTIDLTKSALHSIL